MVNANIQNVQARFGQDQFLCKTGRNKTNFSAIQLHTIGRIKSILNIVWVSESLKETLSLIYKIDANCKNQKPNNAKKNKNKQTFFWFLLDLASQVSSAIQRRCEEYRMSFCASLATEN